jgi:hypothetical protein
MNFVEQLAKASATHPTFRQCSQTEIPGFPLGFPPIIFAQK